MKRKEPSVSYKDARSFNSFHFSMKLLKSTGKFLILALLTISVSITSCGKDDDENDDENGIPEENHLKHDARMYEISDGILEYYGQWWDDTGGFNFDITLFSSGITFDEELEDFTGKGNMIMFEMFSESKTELKPGTYTFDADQSYDAGTFDRGLFFLNYDIETETAEVTGEIAGGTVKVEKSGSTYKITIDCTDNKGEKLTGFYEGTLDYYDWSDFWAKSSEKSGKRHK